MNDSGVRGAYAAPPAPRSPLTILGVLRARYLPILEVRTA